MIYNPALYLDIPTTDKYVSVLVSDYHDIVRYDNFVRLLLKADTEPMMAMHVALGVCGEAGELADAIKREYIYNKPRNRENIVEELGDLRFYMQAVQNHYNISESELLQYNAEKLAKRYAGLQYSNAAAQNRADKQGESKE